MITIQANRNRRKVLTFDTPFALETNQNFPESMFDAVFILSSSPGEAKAILNEVNPVTSNKCCYKPLFVSKELEGHLGEYGELIDGYTYDINEESILQKTEELILHREKIGLQRSSDGLVSSNLFFIRLCRYLISRKKYRLTPMPQEGSSMGYVIPVFDLFYRLGKFHLNEYIIFCQSMQEKEYFRTVSFVNKIHLCPQCLHSHLLYIECCPQCGSSSIGSEEVIHHFRCANISPEHTYNWGGQLRCPKCHQLLRHIGVDYDRPSMVYTCNSCEDNFLQPRMKALCTSCHKESDVTSLVPHDIAVFEITDGGQRALASQNIGFTVYTDFYDNFLEFDRFVNRLRLLAGQKGLAGDKANISVTRVWVLDGENATSTLNADSIAFFCEKFPNRKVSSANNMIYIKETEYDRNGGSGEEFLFMLHDCLKGMVSRILPDEKICYVRTALENNDSGAIEEFINSLYYVSPEPEESFEYEENGISALPDIVAEPALTEQETVLVTEKIEDEISPSSEFAANQKVRKTRGFWIVIFSFAVSMFLLLFWILYSFFSKENTHIPHLIPESAVKEIPVNSTAGCYMEKTGGMLQHAVNSAIALPQNEAEGNDDPFAVHSLIPGYHHVVVGTFSTSENTKRNIRELSEKVPSLNFRIYRHDSRFVVVPFCSAEKSSCIEFVRIYRKYFPGAYFL